MDSMQKRVSFIEAAAALAAVPNVEPLCGRAEDLGREPGHRDAYAVAVARAVADAPVLAEYCLPFVAPGGLWVAAKGPVIDVRLHPLASLARDVRTDSRLGQENVRELGAACPPTHSHVGNTAGNAIPLRPSRHCGCLNACVFEVTSEWAL